MKLPTGEYISIVEYAESKKITRQAVYLQIKKGQVEGYKIGRCWVIKV